MLSSEIGVNVLFVKYFAGIKTYFPRGRMLLWSSGSKWSVNAMKTCWKRLATCFDMCAFPLMHPGKEAGARYCATNSGVRDYLIPRRYIPILSTDMPFLSHMFRIWSSGDYTIWPIERNLDDISSDSPLSSPFKRGYDPVEGDTRSKKLTRR